MKKLIALYLSVIVALSIVGCGKEAASSPGGKAISLTEKEISQSNEAFVSVLSTEQGLEVTEISCFFTSFYEKPEAINFVEFLRYCPIGERLEDINSEEYAAFVSALEQADPSIKDSPSLPVPVRRYPKEAVSAILKKYANITIDDLLNTEGVIYLEEYDAFYNMTSDFAPGSFQCTGGEKIGNTIYLWSDADENKMRIQLTIVVGDENYYIQSFQEVKE